MAQPHNRAKARSGRKGKNNSPWRHGYKPYPHRVSDGPYCPITDRARLQAEVARNRRNS